MTTSPKHIAHRVLTEAERALVLGLLDGSAGREAIGRALRLNPNYLPVIMRANGLFPQWSAGMLAYRKQFHGRPEAGAVEVSDGRNREASARLAERLILTGVVATPAARPERTFAEKLQLLAEGKARLVPNIRISRPVNALTSAHGEAMT